MTDVWHHQWDSASNEIRWYLNGIPQEHGPREDKMQTYIDHYIDDALDDVEWESGDGGGYFASRDVDEPADTNLTKDVAFRRRSFGATESAVPTSDGHVAVGVDGIEVELVQGVAESDLQHLAALTIAAPTGRNPEDVNWEEVLRGGLGQVLESQVIAFAVKGVSRACTHQIVRTRKGAFHQQSQRAVYYGPHPEMRIAESVWKNHRARAAALRAMYFAHKAYEAAIEEDISYQDARLILPEGTTNWIICEYPLPVFIDTYAYRACSMFQWEIVTVFRKMRQVLVAAHPWLEPYVKISCEKTHGALDGALDREQFADYPTNARVKRGDFDHACTYQGHERVEDQCDFPWARESNRTFVPDPEHRIERKL